MSLNEEVKRIWQNENYMPLEDVKRDFELDEPQNLKVKVFKKLLERYKDKQIEFEKSDEIFSPYFVGYGNITSPIWFLGNNEGGPDQEKDTQNRKYNEEARRINILSYEKIRKHVLIKPYELINEYDLWGRDKYGNDRKFFNNFDYAAKIMFTALFGIDRRHYGQYLQSFRQSVGMFEFYSEYWRYRVPSRFDFNDWLNENRNRYLDMQRNEFLKDLDATLKPKFIVAYFTTRDITTAMQKAKELFDIKRILALPDIDKLSSLTHRPVLLSGFLGQSFSNEKAEIIGKKIRELFNVTFQI
ncbi:MAG: hypothetical protein ABIK31_04505 [candidate division WOR-3 bacterium]